MVVTINNGRAFVAACSIGMEITPVTAGVNGLTLHRLGTGKTLYLLLDDAIALYETNPASKRWGRDKIWAHNLARLHKARAFAADQIAMQGCT